MTLKSLVLELYDSGKQPLQIARELNESPYLISCIINHHRRKAA